MQEPSVKAFKNELRNYTFYQTKVVSLTNSIEMCYDRLGGVRGIDPSKEPLHTAPNKELEWQIREEIEIFIKEKELFDRKIAYIERVLSQIDEPYRSAVTDIFAHGVNSYKVASGMNYSQSGLLHQINKSIKMALEVK